MTKKEIVRTISDDIGLTQLKTKEIVQKTFDAIIDALAVEGRIELRNFGVLRSKNGRLAKLEIRAPAIKSRCRKSLSLRLSQAKKWKRV